MKLFHIYYVYILKCSDGSYYTGMTSNIEKRLDEHHRGFYTKCYTYKRRPVTLKFSEPYQFVLDAISREKQIKGWNREKKEALIDSNWERLVMLSRNRLRPLVAAGIVLR